MNELINESALKVARKLMKFVSARAVFSYRRDGLTLTFPDRDESRFVITATPIINSSFVFDIILGVEGNGEVCSDVLLVKYKVVDVANESKNEKVGNWDILYHKNDDPAFKYK